MKGIIAQPAPAESSNDWQKTQYSNLIRHVPSGTYYARLRVKGKLIRRSLKTDVLSVAKLRLSDFEKNERQGAENRDSVSAGHKDGGALAMKVYGHLRDQHSVAMAQKVTFGRGGDRFSCRRDERLVRIS